MDVGKASYFSITHVGNLELFLEKMRRESKTIDKVKNMLDADGMSLLENCLAYKRLDIAQYLLDNGANMNIITLQRCNELHYIAAHLNNGIAIEIAQNLVAKDVDLNLRDKKFNNSAFWYIAQEMIKNNMEGLFDLAKMCFEKNPDIDTKNVAGISIREMISERGCPALQEFVLKE